MPDPALEVIDLWFSYEDEDSAVLRGLNLAIQRGEFVALVGANGSGKTTLTKHFNGLLRPKRGQVRVAGRDAGHQSVGELARSVGYLFQHPEQQIFGPTVRHEVAFGPQNLGLSATQVEAHVEAALSRFGLTAVADSPPAIMSYGIRRRITLASLAAMDSQVLVLDEPTVGLDAPSRHETFEWLDELHQQGRAILLVTHDMALAARHAERIVVLYRGEITADGTASSLFQETDLLSRASLTPPPVTVLAQALSPFGMVGNSLTVETFCDEIAALMRARAPGDLSQGDKHEPAL